MGTGYLDGGTRSSAGDAAGAKAAVAELRNSFEYLISFYSSQSLCQAFAPGPLALRSCCFHQDSVLKSLEDP